MSEQLMLMDAALVADQIAETQANGLIPAYTQIFPKNFDSSAVTELGMAKALYEVFKGRVHVIHETGAWYVADEESGLWRPDMGGETVSAWFRKYLEDGRAFTASLIFQKQDETAKKFLAELRKLERQTAVQGAKDFLKSMPNMTISQTQFDTDSYVAGLKGGMCVDLKTDTVRKIKPSDYITKTLGTHYDPDAGYPLFEKSIFEWCCGNQELVKFLQVWAGYCLSGLTEVQKLLFLYGGGRNGKSVLTNILTMLAGDYAQTMPSDCLMAKDTSASNDIARLVGKRFVTAVELPENKVMDDNRVKQLTGGDVIAARAMYKDYFEFRPVMKLTISGNHKPIIKGNDFGIWRRIYLVPFNAQIAEEDIDPALTEKLKQELPGILNWALEGFRQYQQEGLVAPQCVIEESEQYKAEMDVVGQWMSQAVEKAPGQHIKAADMYARFKGWAKENGFFQMNSTSFGRAMTDRLSSKKTNQGKVYLDVQFIAGDCDF